MHRLRPLLSVVLLFSTMVVPCAIAQTTLTQIQDTVYNTDGSLFNGTLLVTWTGTGGSSASIPNPSNASVTIYNGALSLRLVPSTTSPGSAPYTAVFTSSSGLVTWTETWEVPPATTPLNLSEVNVSSSTSAGTQITISQVVGLTSDLNAINGSLASLTSTANGINSAVTTLTASLASLTTLVNGLAAGGGTTNVAFVDAEAPSGTVNGSNTVFTLANTPVSATALDVYVNGLLLSNGVDYSLSGKTLTFGITSIPQSGDTLRVYYRMASSGGTTPVFVDNVVPTGTINGSTLAFTLASTPAPLLSLMLYKNGDLMQQNLDYTISGTTITFASTSVTPQTGDTLVAYYRISQ